MNNKRTFIYQPYAENGDAVLLYFHKKPSEKDNYNSWDMTGVDVPTKECPNEWSFGEIFKMMKLEMMIFHMICRNQK